MGSSGSVEKVPFFYRFPFLSLLRQSPSFPGPWEDQVLVEGVGLFGKGCLSSSGHILCFDPFGFPGFHSVFCSDGEAASSGRSSIVFSLVA